MNLNLFLSAFLRIFPYKKDIQDSLSKSAKATHIFLDTNTIIADISHFDPNHETTNGYLRFLESIGLQIYYTKETFYELGRYLEKVKDVVSALKFYPALAAKVADECDNPLVKSYIEEDYINWDLFCNEFMGKFNNNVYT